jgi:hypothetical protein
LGPSHDWIPLKFLTLLHTHWAKLSIIFQVFLPGKWVPQRLLLRDYAAFSCFFYGIHIFSSDLPCNCSLLMNLETLVGFSFCSVLYCSNSVNF